MKTRQIFVESIGGYSAVKARIVEVRDLEEEEVLVEVRSAGLNFYDIYVRHGIGLNARPPCLLGLECSGIVRNIGRNVSSIKVGDHVVVHCPEGGAFAELVVASESFVLAVPHSVDFDFAAALTINYMTAHFALVEMGRIRSGNSVLIQGAAGGVGWAATQIAKREKDVKVFGVSSIHKREDILNNGVDVHIASNCDVAKEVRKASSAGVSIILESNAGSSLSQSINLLEPFGKVILIGAKSMVTGENRNWISILKTWWQTKNVSPYELIMQNIGVAGFNLNTCRLQNKVKFMEVWKKLSLDLHEKKIQPKIDSVFSFEEIDQACQRITERKNIGKIILRP